MCHLQEYHGMEMNVATAKFDNFDEFLAWKEQEEQLANASYVLHNAQKYCSGNEVWYFYCNRAGSYAPCGKSERALKSQGTSKTISHCSAHMKAIKNKETNEVSVTYTCTHYNHTHKLGRLHIAATTSEKIASKLQNGVTSERIIDDIRNISDSTDLHREHLISRKDIANIKRQYYIEGVQRHHNDLLSVSAIVEEMETLKYNPILIFKQQGEEANDLCSCLDKNDFLLVIQTEFQRDMFKKYGNRGVCIDATYRVNDYDFHLITILVLDDFQEGIPVA